MTDKIKIIVKLDLDEPQARGLLDLVEELIDPEDPNPSPADRVIRTLHNNLSAAMKDADWLIESVTPRPAA